MIGMFIKCNAMSILFSEENISLHLYAEADRSMLVDSESSCIFCITINFVTIMLHFSDKVDEANERMCRL